MSENDFDTACIGLNSTSIAKRKKSHELLRELMAEPRALKCLNAKQPRFQWDNILHSVQQYLIKESDKMWDDELKGKATSDKNKPKAKFSGCLLIEVVSKANYGAHRINGTKLLRCVLTGFETAALRKYYTDIYIDMLVRYILPVKEHWADIDNKKFIDLFSVLKELYTKCTDVNKFSVIEAIYLLCENSDLKYPLLLHLRQEFQFINKICQDFINARLPNNQQEMSVKLALAYCEKLSWDCRLAVCKLGEELMNPIIGLHQSRYDRFTGINKYIFNFALLQVRIHHPKGNKQNTTCAYAFNWAQWTRQLKSMYSLICKEIHAFVNSTNFRNSDSKQNLCPDFLQLTVEVFNQVFRENFQMDMETTLDESLPNKRRKIDFGIPFMITEVQQKNSWAWLEVFSELLNIYPDCMNAGEYLNLLQILTKIQSECKDISTRHHLYELLTVMIKNEQIYMEDLADTNIINSQWNTVWETALRVVGLYQYDESVHKLIRALLISKRVQPTGLFNIYMSKVLNNSTLNIQTLNVLFQNFSVPENFTNGNDTFCTRKFLIKWIFDLNDKNKSDAFTHKITARVLLNLVLRNWVYTNITDKRKPRKYEDIENLCILTSFENLESPSGETGKLDNNYLTHSESYLELLEIIQNFTTALYETEVNMNELIIFTNFLVLLLNVLSQLFEFGVINVENVPEIIDFDRLYEVFTDKLTEYLSEKRNNRLAILTNIERIFSMQLNKEVSNIVRNKVTVPFMQIFFEILNEDGQDSQRSTPDFNRSQEFDSYNEEDSKISTSIANIFSEASLKTNEKLSVVCMSIITKFFGFPGSSSFNDTQQHALETVTEDSDIDPHKSYEVQMTIHILNALNSTKPGTLTRPILFYMLTTITKILISWQNSSEIVYLIEIIKNGLIHFHSSNSDELKNSFLKLLEPFFENRENHSIKVNCAVLNCLGHLSEVDPLNEFGNSQQVTLWMTKYLKSDFIQLRLLSMKNIVRIFATELDGQTIVTKQKQFFHEICCNILISFAVGDHVTEEQKMDESVNRTASALHSYASLITTSPNWRKRTLFAMIQLASERKLNYLLVRKVLNTTSKKLHMSNAKELIDLNMNYLITHWNKVGYELSIFPFQLIGCENSNEFFNEYLNVVVPVLIRIEDLNLLNQVCKDANKTVSDVVQESFPVIIARYLPVFSYLQNPDERTIGDHEKTVGERVQKTLEHLLTKERITDLLILEVDKVFIQVMNRFFDPEHFKQQFGFSQTLPEPDPPSFDFQVFTYAVHYIEKQLQIEQSVISYCIKEEKQKLVTIIHQITSDIYKIPTTEEKLKGLHRYTVLVDYMIPQLQSNKNLRVYLIRSIIHTLMNLIKEHVDNSDISIAACRYFMKFTTKCLQSCSDIFEKFLTLVISTLVPIGKLDTHLSEECIRVLNYLIVENSKMLYNTIGKLDPFPNHDNFRNMNDIWQKIKYGNDKFTLEQEITHFLNAGELMDSSFRYEGLKNLKNLFSKNKQELADLYSKLYDLRGFSEDCIGSILHQLIYMLIKLTNTDDLNISTEAARCLGELGPADLTTMVLKPEKNISEITKKPLELIPAQVIALLSKYIVESNVEVTTASINGLKAILSSKEGKNIAKAQNHTDFGCVFDLDYIAPFVGIKSSGDSGKWVVNEQIFVSLVDNDEVWCPTTSCTHSKWVIRLICNMLKTFPKNTFMKDLIPICKLKVEFAEYMFPLIVYLFIYYNSKHCVAVLSKQFQNFFQSHWNYNYKNALSQASTSDFITQNKASVQCMLNVVHFLRMQKSSCTERKLPEFELNYLHVAQGAQFCGAHFTSILYAELWCYSKLDDKMISTQSGLSSLDVICGTEEQDISMALQNILREGYKKIGDREAMHGCGISYLLDPKAHVEHYKYLGRWDKVALHYDCELSLGMQLSSKDFLESLQNIGLYHLSCTVDNKNRDAMCESAWRLGQWDIPIQENTPIGIDFEKYHYLALKAFHEDDNVSVNQSIAKARKIVVQSLKHASLESSKNLYPSLTQLQSLVEIENFSETDQMLDIYDVIRKWKTSDLMNRNQFTYVEPIQAQRITILRDLLQKNEDEDVKFSLIDIYLKLADEARVENYVHVAQRALSNLAHIEHLSPDQKARMTFQRAQLSWIEDKTEGRFLLRHLIENTEPSPLLASTIRQYGSWMAETRSENPQTIIEKYFKKSIDILNDPDFSEHFESKCETMNCLARFADAQYKQVKSYMSSSVYQDKVRTIDRFKTMAEQIKVSGDLKKTSDHRRAYALYQRQSDIDEAEVNNARREKDMYLTLAVTHYLKLLQESDAYNLKVFRILSLCLSNKQNVDLIEILRDNLDKIPSYKFIPCLPQIVPHIGNAQMDLFDEQINKILELCMLYHPHHTIPIILALAESYKDREFEKSTNSTDPNESRVISAKQLILKYKKHPELGPIIVNMQQVSTALIHLAYLPSDKCTASRHGSFTIPRTEKIKSIKNVQNVLIPTVNLAVNKSCDYSNIVGIYEFGSSFSLVGGVNEPKRISCTGTDGKVRTQLVKGKDDLRQDAVMQQVFTIMNTLLAKNKQTNKLLIRTYKVVPLSQRSGVLEWCENTEPLGEYLNNAHKQYHPTDWTPSYCRQQMKAVAGTKSKDVKYRVYKDICANFRPIFHMFFISSFPQPTVWYECRRAYMQSVATSSMVGYILGLGDRHVQNILIDKCTAEVIHIDFGIAFEQGRILPTPETVPFRLTRDIEAGMGVCGIEGVFRRSCEKTMLVLRQNEETILTILEVLLYDPLYAWTITPAEAYSRQKDDDTEGSIKFSEGDSANITAERALTRLKQKLQGTESGGVLNCSVEGQVEQLLQEARDPTNLCRLFNGWQPYL